MVADGGLRWNYNFQGVKHNVSMDYTVRLDTPVSKIGTKYFDLLVAFVFKIFILQTFFN